MKGISANFDFLGKHDAQLVRLGGLAERYFKDDPNTSLIKLRQFGERHDAGNPANLDLYYIMECLLAQVSDGKDFPVTRRNMDFDDARLWRGRHQRNGRVGHIF